MSYGLFTLTDPDSDSGPINRQLLLPPVNEVCEGYVFTRVCHSVHRGRGGGIPACTTGHMTKHYISSCTGDQSQLVTGQHTGNIKCMMG